MQITNTTPVLLEWWTARIPSTHCTVVVRYAVALYWQRKGYDVHVRLIDPALLAAANHIAVSHEAPPAG